jgi:uncharacterized protein YbjT (DUF2867 family)
MHILVLGGTGRTGQPIISEALSHNHTVTALIRTSGSLSSLQTPSLTTVIGSPQSQADVELAFASQTPDAVLVALSSNEIGFMAGVHRILVSVIKQHGLEAKTKVVTMQAIGVGSSNKHVWWPMRLVLNYSPLSKGQEDHNLVEGVMRESGLMWTLPRPVMLTDGVKKDVVICGDDGGEKVMGRMPSVSRKSVAGFMVAVAEDATGKWTERTPVIGD